MPTGKKKLHPCVKVASGKAGWNRFPVRFHPWTSSSWISTMEYSIHAAGCPRNRRASRLGLILPCSAYARSEDRKTPWVKTQSTKRGWVDIPYRSYIVFLEESVHFQRSTRVTGLVKGRLNKSICCAAVDCLLTCSTSTRKYGDESYLQYNVSLGAGSTNLPIFIKPSSSPSSSHCSSSGRSWSSSSACLSLVPASRQGSSSVSLGDLSRSISMSSKDLSGGGSVGGSVCGQTSSRPPSLHSRASRCLQGPPGALKVLFLPLHVWIGPSHNGWLFCQTPPLPFFTLQMLAAPLQQKGLQHPKFIKFLQRLSQAGPGAA